MGGKQSLETEVAQTLDLLDKDNHLLNYVQRIKGNCV